VNRQEIRSAIDLSGAGVNDPDGGVVFRHASRINSWDRAVDLEIHKGIFHGVEMACLSGEVKQKVLTLHQVGHAEFIPNVRNIDSDTGLHTPSD